MPTPKPRAPEAIRKRIHDLLARLEKGPEAPMRHHESAEHMAGMDEAWRRQESWRETWVLPHLRQVAAYVDGIYTAAEIDIYQRGDRYDPKNLKEKF